MVAAQRDSLPSWDWERGAVTAPHPQYPAEYKNAEKKPFSLLDLFMRFSLCTFNDTILPIYKSNTLKQCIWSKREAYYDSIWDCQMYHVNWIMDNFQIRPAGIQQGQDQKGAYQREGCRQQEMSPYLVHLPLPWERTEQCSGAEMKVTEESKSTTCLGRARARQQNIFLYLCGLSPPSFPQVGAFSSASSNKKHIQLNVKNQP